MRATEPGHAPVAASPAPDCPRPLLVLMYHGIHASAQDRGHFDPRYSVAPQAFAAQMAILGRQRERIWLPGDAVATGTAADADPALMLSFDDGDVSNAERALPCLLDRGLRAMFFVTSQHLRRDGWLSIAQLRELAEAGMGIGSHGASHRFLAALDEDALSKELRDSRAVLEAVGGRRVDCLALPGGRGGAREVACARALGYRLVFGSQPGINAGPAGPAPLQRVAITRDTDLAAFRQILAWRGLAVQRLCWRHRLLALPKRLIGDGRYDRLRQALLG